MAVSPAASSCVCTALRMASRAPDGTAAIGRARPLWAAAQAELAQTFGTARTDDLVRELPHLVGAS